MTKEPAKQTNKDNEDLTPYVTKGGKIVLENAPEMWRGGRYAAESAWKHGVKKPIGKLWFKWDAHTIGKDANTIYDIVNSMDRMAASAMVVSREYAELYKEMATKINIYIKDLDSEDYYYGHAYEMFDQSVAAINYIFAKLLKISPLFKTGGVFKEGDEKKQKRLPQNLRDLIETVEEEDVVITFTPEDTPLEVVNKNLGNITAFNPLKEGKSVSVSKVSLGRWFGGLAKELKDRFYAGEHKMVEPYERKLQMYPFVIYGEGWKDLDRQAYDDLTKPAIEMLDMVEDEHEKQKQERKKEEKKSGSKKSEEKPKEEKQSSDNSDEISKKIKNIVEKEEEYKQPTEEKEESPNPNPNPDEEEEPKKENKKKEKKAPKKEKKKKAHWYSWS